MRKSVRPLSWKAKYARSSQRFFLATIQMCFLNQGLSLSLQPCKLLQKRERVLWWAPTATGLTKVAQKPRAKIITLGFDTDY
jgi:hypothetical protein